MTDDPIAALVRLADEHDGDFEGAVADADIAAAEEVLGVVFPQSFRRFLESLGAGDVAGVELYGIVGDPRSAAPGPPDAVGMTLRERAEFGLPASMIIVGDDGMGGWYVLDTAVAGEPPLEVVYLSPEGIESREHIAPSYGEGVLEVVRRML